MRSMLYDHTSRAACFKNDARLFPNANSCEILCSWPGPTLLKIDLIMALILRFVSQIKSRLVLIVHAALSGSYCLVHNVMVYYSLAHI